MNSPLEISVPGQNHFSVFSLDHLTDVPGCPLAAGRKVMLLEEEKNRDGRPRENEALFPR